jgi:nitrous oxide reductase
MNRMSALIMAAATASLVGFAPASLHAQASSAKEPVPAEKNPPGDIPDNQVFNGHLGKAEIVGDACKAVTQDVGSNIG